MKLIHLSDIHLGKRLKEFSLLDDQKFILDKILKIIFEQSPDAICIAGDVYDKSIPSVEAVELFDEFLYRLASLKIPVFIASGNHDSPERLSFGNRLFDVSGIHLSPVYDGEVKPFTLHDEFGEVNVYMLPFLKPSNVKRFFPDEEIKNYTDAVAVAVKHMNIDTSKRNVLIAHQFVTGAKRSESEDISVGGLDNVDVTAFYGFDYVALGHLHSPQTAGSSCVYYCGTPLKYSFSEINDEKSVALVEIKQKWELSITPILLTPKREMRQLRGSFDELMARSFYGGTSYPEDYVRITLTDENDVIDAMAKLRTVYRFLTDLNYDNTRTRSTSSVGFAENAENKTPLELFSELYERQNGQTLSEKQSEYMQKLIEEIWGE